MKCTFHSLAVKALMLLGISSELSYAAVIIPASGTASTSFSGRGIANTYNGSGLTGGDSFTATHGVSPTTMWNTTQDDNAASLTFDLGVSCNINSIRLWNFNENNSTRGFGLKTIEVFAGTTVGALTSRGTLTFNIATGTSAYTPTDYDVTALGLNGVSIVKFVVLSNQAGATFNSAGTATGTVPGLDTRRYAGISEIRFLGEAVPEPSSSIIAITLGGACLLKRRRQAAALS